MSFGFHEYSLLCNNPVTFLSNSRIKPAGSFCVTFPFTVSDTLFLAAYTWKGEGINAFLDKSILFPSLARTLTATSSPTAKVFSALSSLL